MHKKKLLGPVMALALLIPYGPASADVLKNVKVDGSIDLQATSANNVTDFNTKAYDQIGNTQARVMVNTGFDLLDDVHAMATLRDNNFNWGQNNQSASAGSINAANSNNSQQINGGATTGLLNSIMLDQAYIKVDKVLGAVDTTLGRQFYGNPGDMVIYYGPYSNLFGLSVSAIDAARFDWSNDMVGVTGLAGRQTTPLTGGPLATNGTGSIGSESNGGVNASDVTGLNATLKGNDMWNAGAFIWNRETHKGSAAGGNDNLYVAGLKGKIAVGPAWLKAEFAKDFGQNRIGFVGPTAANYDGWAFKADAGVKADLGVASVNPWAQFADGSGGQNNNKNYGFVGINPDYRPGGIYGYFSSIDGMTGRVATFDNANLGDRTIWGAGVSAMPSAISKLTVGVSYWNYHFQSALGEAQEFAAAGFGSPNGNKYLGDEVDVNLGWKHSDNVAFNVGWGQMWAGGALKDSNRNSGNGNNPANLFNFTASVKF